LRCWNRDSLETDNHKTYLARHLLPIWHVAEISATLGGCGLGRRAEVSTDWRQAMEDVMAKVFEFYIPASLPRKMNNTASNDHGKLIEFPSPKGWQADEDRLWRPEMSAAYIAPLGVNLAKDQKGDTA
jgi:hypothetical protein